jgi:hypothetical protein
MRLKGVDLVEDATILIGVSDGVLADSLQFSLELEGFEVKVCDACSLPSAMARAKAGGCGRVVDHDVFTRMANCKSGRRFVELGFPVVLMVNDTTEKVLARAKERARPRWSKHRYSEESCSTQ